MIGTLSWKAQRKYQLEYLRPSQIVEARDRFPLVYVPVGPLEWHSFQNPFGLDGIVPHWLCIEAAVHLGGVVMPPLFLGMDQERTPEQRQRWGLPEQGPIFGMSFPALPLSSIYCEAEHLKRSITLYLEWARSNGFRYGVVLSHHGGLGNHDTCAAAAKACETDHFKTLTVPNHQLKDHARMEYLGKHAGIAETERVLGLHPELVDYTDMPTGEIPVAQFGMLGSDPIIPADLNPRHANRARGRKQIRIAVEILCGKIKDLIDGDRP